MDSNLGMLKYVLQLKGKNDAIYIYLIHFAIFSARIQMWLFSDFLLKNEKVDIFHEQEMLLNMLLKKRQMKNVKRKCRAYPHFS